jgi:hypothetical protein
VSTNIQRPSEPEASSFQPDGFSVSKTLGFETTEVEYEHHATLASLPTGARLVVRCKKDWRAAVVSTITTESIKLLVNSPRGGTYRLRRPPDAPLRFDGIIPLLGEEDEITLTWRDDFAVYDRRW